LFFLFFLQYLRYVEPRTADNFFHGDPLDHHDQVRETYGAGRRFFGQGGQGDRALFQSLVVEHKAPGLPLQKFDAVAAPVDENKYLPAGRITVQFVSYQATQSVKPFPEIGRFAVQQVFVGCGEGKHITNKRTA
jgi:hypothetical protein